MRGAQPRVWTDERREKFLKEYSSCKSVRELAASLGVSVEQCYEFAKHTRIKREHDVMAQCRKAGRLAVIERNRGRLSAKESAVIQALERGETTIPQMALSTGMAQRAVHKKLHDLIKKRMVRMTHKPYSAGIGPGTQSPGRYALIQTAHADVDFSDEIDDRPFVHAWTPAVEADSTIVHQALAAQPLLFNAWR